MSKKFIFYLATVLILSACTGNRSGQNNSDSTHAKAKNGIPEKDLPELVSDSQLTAFSRFISGQEYGYTFKANKSATWKNYAAGTDKNWNHLDAKIGSKIRDWVKQESLEQKNEPGTLFYPFAGGDFYYANLFFPKQDTIVMIGLEPCGRIFNPDTANADTLQKYYGVLQHSMFFPHQLGFFRTKSMSKDFNNSLLNGTIHTLLFYLARADYNIHYIQYFNVDKTGKEIQTTDAAKTGRAGFNAYRIGYSKGARGLVKEVIYFSQDASDGALKAKPGIMAYMEKRNKVVTFYKAASYLMQYERFSIVRNYAIKRSVRILQDDSGVPYKYLKENNFEIKLYGKFTATLNMFKEEFQPDLRDAYQASKADSLPFLIGYMAPRKECNLLHAVSTKK